MHPLHGFLKKVYGDDDLKVELTSANALRFSYTVSQCNQVKHLKHMIDIIRVVEPDKKILDVLPFSAEQKILIRQSLWVNVIISYAKFFTSKGEDEASVPHIQIQPSSCYKGASTALLGIHDKIMATRHKCLAHGVQNDEEHVIPYMYLKVIDDNTVDGALGVNAIGPISYSLSDLNIVVQLLDMLEIYLSTRKDKLVEKVYADYENIQAQQWYDAAVKNESL